MVSQIGVPFTIILCSHILRYENVAKHVKYQAHSQSVYTRFWAAGGRFLDDIRVSGSLVIMKSHHLMRHSIQAVGTASGRF